MKGMVLHDTCEIVLKAVSLKPHVVLTEQEAWRNSPGEALHANE